MLIEEERKIEYAMCMESRAIWSKAVGKGKEERGE